MFGREAAKLLNYVECFPGGFRKGTIMAKACIDVGIEGFPTWVINGQVINPIIDYSIFSIYILMQNLAIGTCCCKNLFKIDILCSHKAWRFLQVLSGEKDFTELAQESGFELNESSPPP